MATRDDELRVRSGRIKHGNKGSHKPKSFVGQVMRMTKGQANPGLLNDLVTKKLEG